MNSRYYSNKMLASEETIIDAHQLVLEGLGDKTNTDIDHRNDSFLSHAGRDVVLFVGPPGAGKSTSINYLLGCEFKGRIWSNGIRIPNCVNPVAGIGDDPAQPHTLYARAYVDPEDDGIFYEDTPGFLADRSEAHRICESLTTEWSVRAAKSCRIVITLDYAGFTSSRGSAVTELLSTLSELFNNPYAHPNSFYFIVTKADRDYFEIDDIERVKNLKSVFGSLLRKDEKRNKEVEKNIEAVLRESGYVESTFDHFIEMMRNKNQEEKNSFFSSLPQDIKNKLNDYSVILTALDIRIKFIDFIINNVPDKNFLLLNLEDSAAIPKIKQSLKKLTPVNYSEFNFSNYDGIRANYNNTLDSILSFSINEVKEYERQLLKLINNTRRESELEVEMKSCAELLADVDKGITPIINLEDLTRAENERINENKAEISNLLSEIGVKAIHDDSITASMLVNRELDTIRAPEERVVDNKYEKDSLLYKLQEVKNNLARHKRDKNVEEILWSKNFSEARHPLAFFKETIKRFKYQDKHNTPISSVVESMKKNESDRVSNAARFVYSTEHDLQKGVYDSTYYSGWYENGYAQVTLFCWACNRIQNRNLAENLVREIATYLESIEGKNNTIKTKEAAIKASQEAINDVKSNNKPALDAFRKATELRFTQADHELQGLGDLPGLRRDIENLESAILDDKYLYDGINEVYKDRRLTFHDQPLMDTFREVVGDFFYKRTNKADNDECSEGYDSESINDGLDQPDFKHKSSSSTGQLKVPSYFVDKFTGEVMNNPVVLECGHSYSRDSINNLQEDQNQDCPHSISYYPHKINPFGAFPNYMLAQAIEAWRNSGFNDAFDEDISKLSIQDLQVKQELLVNKIKHMQAFLSAVKLQIEDKVGSDSSPFDDVPEPSAEEETFTGSYGGSSSTTFSYQEYSETKQESCSFDL